jgi:hypothetical protein
MASPYVRTFDTAVMIRRMAVSLLSGSLKKSYEDEDGEGARGFVVVEAVEVSGGGEGVGGATIGVEGCGGRGDFYGISESWFLQKHNQCGIIIWIAWR